jgi:chromosome segregation ATPase
MAKLKTLQKTADKLNKQVRKTRAKLDALITEQQKAQTAIRDKHVKLNQKQERKDAKKAAKNDPSPAIPAPVGGKTDMATVASKAKKAKKKS